MDDLSVKVYKKNNILIACFCLLLFVDFKSYAQCSQLDYNYINPTNELKLKNINCQLEPKTSKNSMRDFILSDANKYKLIVSNSFLWLVPPLIWNIAWGTNNSAQLGFFDGEAPQSLLVTENIFRVSAMMYPLLLPIKSQNKKFKQGLITYLVGSAVYYASWTYLMNNPDSQLSQTTMMRFAPAYTPLIWLTGISLMSNSKIHFSLSAIFIGLHVGEYICRY